MHLLLILLFVLSVQGYQTQLSASGMVRYQVGHGKFNICTSLSYIEPSLHCAVISFIGMQ